MNSEILYLNSLKDKSLGKEGFFISEGREVTLRLFQSGLPVRDVLCTPKLLEEFSGLIPADAGIHVMSEQEMSSLLGFKFHRGILASAPIPRIPTMEEALQENRGHIPSWKQEKAQRILICPAISDLENLGSLYRCAAAMGWDAILLGEGFSNPYSRRVIRVSMGAVFMIKTFKITALEQLKLLKDKQFLLLGTSLDARSKDLDTVAETIKKLEALESCPQALGLMFGHEFEGLPKAWGDYCDQLVKIPMCAGPDSLNVAASAAICCYVLGSSRP